LTDDRDTIPLCCKATISVVQRTHRAGICPVCDEEYLPDASTRPALLPGAPREPAPAHHRGPLPGAAPDDRVHVATEAHLRPSSIAPVARLTHVEDDELVRVRRLLCELRPDKGGPLGWPADGVPPAPSGSSWMPSERIQTSVVTPSILPGAFATQAPTTRAPYCVEGGVLHWCQRFGSLAGGLRAFYEAATVVAAETGREIARVTRRLTPEGAHGDLTDIQPPDATVDVCPDAAPHA
jgi:hypothetical protein